MSEPFGWGILGCGGISRKFAGELISTTSAKLKAVGSRDAAKAEDFAASFGGADVAGTYDEVLASDAVEAVYIGLPNALHCEWAIKAMQAGKHVLCEKPLGVNAGEVEKMFAAADECNQLLTEAFMYRHQPVIAKAIELVKQGAIGKLKIIRSNFTFQRSADQQDIRYQPDMAGGALMDVGCYCVNFARAITGAEPVNVSAVSHHHSHGVDDYSAGWLRFPDDVLCVFTCGMTVQSDRTTIIAGDTGYLEIPDPWFSLGTITHVQNETRNSIDVRPTPHRYALEAEAFEEAVRNNGPLLLTRADSLGNAQTLDRLRKAAGLSY
ncbi:MAG: Gfo/Idh/MocA family oxidoreductase [bacterium]|nr:Gfo/Idh/MocA family oxidoreductase [bacterium]